MKKSEYPSQKDAYNESNHENTIYSNQSVNSIYIIKFTFEENSLRIPLSNLKESCPVIFDQISSLIEKLARANQKKKVRF